MKRILFVVTYLDTGGITKALQNFLLNYNKENFIVDVFALSHQGIFNKSLENCNLIQKNLLIHSLISRFNLLSTGEKLISLLLKSLNKLTKSFIQNKLFAKAIADLENKNEYDAIVGFSEGVPTYFVSKAKCLNKIAWIHCDYANYYSFLQKNELSIYQKMKHIVCVSEYTMRSFISIYPTLKDKTTYIHNIVNSDAINSLASEKVSVIYDANYFNIVSVGRIDPVKRFSSIPKIVKSLLDKSYLVRWYIVGPNFVQSEYSLLLDNIRKYDVVDNVILLGEQKNPYPYIANADLFVSTSSSEACPYVVNEAKILHKPIICTDFGSVYEFITDRKDGYISSLNNLSQTIDFLLSNPKSYEKLKSEIALFEYDNSNILSQIQNLL